MSNADLIERLRDTVLNESKQNYDKCYEAVIALELADKRIEELIQVNCSRLDNAERKLTIALKALELNVSDPFTTTAMDTARKALAQIRET